MATKKDSVFLEVSIVVLCALVALGIYIAVARSSPASGAPQQTPAQSSIFSFQRIPISSVSNLTTENYGYHLRNNQIVCSTRLCGGDLVMSADPAMFVFLYTNNSTLEEPPYTADANAVYCDGKPLAGADPATFQPLFATWSFSLGDYSARFGKDSFHVYFNCTLMPEADAATFQVVSGSPSFNALDKNHEYLNDQVVE